MFFGIRGEHIHSQLKALLFPPEFFEHARQDALIAQSPKCNEHFLWVRGHLESLIGASAIKNPKQPEQDGLYKVKGVTYSGGTSGLRQTIKLHYKIG